MRPWVGTMALILLLAAGAFGATNSKASQGTQPTPLPTPTPSKPVPAKPLPAKVKKTPEKHGANPQDNGGPTKGIDAKAKQCAKGRLVKLDQGAKTIEVANAEKTSLLHFTEKTVLRVGEERGFFVKSTKGTSASLLEALKPGTKVTLYCAPDGLLDVAVLVRVQSDPIKKVKP